MGASSGGDIGLGALREIGQVLAGLKEGKAREYTVIAVLGGKDSGKTALINRFVRGVWEATTTMKRFLDYQSKSISVSGKTVQVVTCEYAGSPEYRLVQKTMFPPTKSVPVKCMLTLDLSRKESQNELNEIVDSLVVPRLNSKSPPETYALVGCKADLKRSISPSDIGAFADMVSVKLRKPMQYVETSAKDGKNVLQAFELLITKQK
ncbi:MAG: ADP-ribosylation factor-like protein [Promethearchaeati archaeon SRVP18_Atabeyarchaeia-1]